MDRLRLLWIGAGLTLLIFVFISFRSVASVICIITPLVLCSLLTYAFMATVGIGIAALILGTGFVGAGYALVGLLNYTRIEQEGIRQITFLKPDKYQRWNEFVAAEITQKEAWDWGKRDRARQSTTITLEFKEGGRWREYITFSSDQFSAVDFQSIQDWLKASLTLVPEPPSPWQKTFLK